MHQSLNFKQFNPKKRVFSSLTNEILLTCENYYHSSHPHISSYIATTSVEHAKPLGGNVGNS